MFMSKKSLAYKNWLSEIPNFRNSWIISTFHGDLQIFHGDIIVFMQRRNLNKMHHGPNWDMYLQKNILLINFPTCSGKEFATIMHIMGLFPYHSEQATSLSPWVKHKHKS
ncbi:hypothetical protein ACJX0J_027777 [Zea mays]